MPSKPTGSRLRGRARWLLAALALTAACSIDTHYTPRTPGRAYLGIRRGEPGVYKDGVLVPVQLSATLMQCSPPAAAAGLDSGEHQASYRRNSAISGALYGLGALMPPLVGFGVYFGIRAAQENQEARAGVIDAINMHNDAPSCTARAQAEGSAP